MTHLRRTGAHRVQSLVDSVRPWHDFIIRDFRVEKLGGEGGLIALPVVFPVPNPIFYRVREKPKITSRGGGHGDHAAIFKEGCLEDPLGHPPIVICWRSGCSGPNLGDVSIYARKKGKACLGADDLPH